MSPFTCPDCGGTLWETGGPVPVFRCRVGHAYAEESFLEAQHSALEQALWAAVVALEERADLVDRLAARMVGRNQARLAIRYEERADAARRQAEQVRDAILSLDTPGEESDP